MVEPRGHVGRGRWAAEFALATAAGVFLGLLGPFGSFFNGPLWERVVYWTAMSWGGYAVFAVVGRLVLAHLPALRGPAWAWLSGFVVVISAPLALASWTLATTLWPGLRRGHGLTPTVWYLESLTITAGQVALFTALLWVRPRAVPPSAAPTSPSLLGAPASEVLCLQMEDHYVRVHTAQGSRLVLATMGQAIAALGRVPGLRVHRSWWVAEKAVASVRADGRNLRLALVGGLTAPVARSSVAAVREAGWLTRGDAGGGEAALAGR
jgi:hypothetical protein